MSKEDTEKFLERISSEMTIRSLDYEEGATSNGTLRENLIAFALSINDIGPFCDFMYPLRYKAVVDLRKVYNKPYPSSLNALFAVAQWIERMYKAAVISDNQVGIECLYAL